MIPCLAYEDIEQGIGSFSERAYESSHSLTVPNKLDLQSFQLKFFYMRSFFKLFVPAVLLVSGLMAADAPILPKVFAGWQQDPTSVKSSNDPSDVDAANASVLKEFGFTELQSAIYTKDSGRKLSLRAARFSDATGAY